MGVAMNSSSTVRLLLSAASPRFALPAFSIDEETTSVSSTVLLSLVALSIGVMMYVSSAERFVVPAFSISEETNSISSTVRLTGP